MCPADDVLEQVVLNAESASVEVRAHIGCCETCQSWIAEARLDDALLGPVARAVNNADAMPAGSSGMPNWNLDVRMTDVEAFPHIDGFTITGRIGQGGMGIVFAAEQLNPPRPVAVKLLRGGALADRDRMRLFEREARALARLSHVSIVPIHAAGITREGAPYIIMERVDGMPLGQYVQANSPSMHDRVQLFLQITRAVTYAHQRGVVHRDIKPSNILVVSNGRPSTAAVAKLLDFGLARITDGDDLSPSAATFSTDTGRIRGTLAYMSPEQAGGRADEIDTRSDVYSLGVVLFELLTDSPPYDVRKGGLTDAVRTIRERPPARPSQFRPALRGDIDTIILKALEKDPSRRYGSVAALEDDLERHLSRRPILAQPASWRYTARKFIARHTIACCFGATILCLLGAMVFSNVIHARRLARERDATARERDRAVEVGKYLEDTLAWFDPTRAKGTEVSLREVLDSASERLETTLRDQPEARAAIHLTLGQGYHSAGVFDKAETHLRQSLELRTALLGEQHVEVADCLMSLARLLKDREEYSAAEPLYQKALAMRRAMLGNEHADVAEALNNYASLLARQYRSDEAEPIMREALAIHRRLTGKDDLDTASGLNNLGLIVFRRGDYVEAERLFRESLALRTSLNAIDSPETTLLLYNLATLVLHARGDSAEAERLMRLALEVRRRILGNDHPLVAEGLENLAQLLSGQSRTDEAIALYRDAVAIHNRNAVVKDGAKSSEKLLAAELRKAGRHAEADALTKP